MNIRKDHFYLTEKQVEKYEQWRDAKIEEVYCGATGGCYSFSFTPTGFGMIVNVTCTDGTELDLTEWEYF